ncbi:PEP-CTERM sorting domain-containing protein [Massilia dura]|uniref:PEP-CTERM sorting domain-containing protein n=1 Tax=Pseudoduganella dura TaxID=321982 RepID=A0A6I3XC08_9BURK|nr:PEP-CTERM sorting domain-containing protein [Pseudoduganella dura]MUI14464.1 PEP-CTERM sorting domain-containing protein [Pseudoduganella dura]GGY07930.1 hypothetical protein GCM10007386_42980 [Pseudoduganella dura]
MRPITKKILITGSFLLGLNATAHASPILLVTNGVLMGAQGVEFGGRHYDVSFSDTRPTAGSLAFHDLAATWGAMDVLDQFVFQGAYDMSPGLTNGCSNPVKCLVVTAFDVNQILATGVAFTNTSTRYLDPIIPYAVLGNAANSAIVTYAHWALQEERQVVPEPSTLWLAGAGLAALLARRRRDGSGAARMHA